MPSAFSVYVHVPYCSRRCPYCDFNTYAVRSVPEERYVDALVREATFAATQGAWQGRRVATVFFGGGTPSLFSPASIGRAVAAIDRLWGLEHDAEVTLEANPGSLEGGGEPKLRGFRAAGINRVSIGAQSFQAVHLATLGRAHSADETRDAVSAARRAGFDNVSCDLMYAVPGQTVAEWEADLDTAVSLGTDHVSAYCLTYEEGTPMTGLKKAGRVVPADEDTELEMLRAARARLGNAGFEHYEVSNWARPGRESRHNLAYWTWDDYLGLGAGAHGFAAATRAGRAAESASAASHASRAATASTVSAASTAPAASTASPAPSADVADSASASSWGRRYANVRLPESYMSAADGRWHASEETLTRDMATAEYMLVGLRLSRGLDTQRFEDLFGVGIDDAAPRLAAFLRDGLLQHDGSVVKLTTRGLEIADAVIARLAAG